MTSCSRPSWRTRAARLAACIAVGVSVAALPGHAGAITENYCSFPVGLSTFTLNGNAFEAAGTVIRLTDQHRQRGRVGVHHDAHQR